MAHRLFLIDGSSYFYRAFFAVRGLVNSKGMPTNAAFGFTTMLTKILKSKDPEAIAVVFDAPGKTFRDDLYKEYKATREAMPEDLVRQLPHVKSIPPAMNIVTLEVPGVEADDVIGTLARRGLAEGFDVILVTGDKDFMQLVTKKAGAPEPGITIYDDMKERIIGIDEVVEKFGVPPERVVDVLALIGDTSDNIPGVRGIGPKFGAELVREFGTVEQILEQIDKVKPRFRGPLETGRADAILSKNLATIRCDLDVPFDPEKLKVRPPDRERLGKIFAELEFTRLLQDLDAGAPKQQTIATDRYRLISSEEALKRLAAELEKAPSLSFDLETTSIDPMRAEIVGFSLCGREGEPAYIPVGHRYLGVPEQLPLQTVLAALKPALTSPKVRKVAQNATYDALILRRHGIEAGPIAFDTMVGAYLIDPDRGPFDLKTLAKKWLSHDMIHYEEVAGKGKGQVTFDQVPVEQAKDYSCGDADVTLRLAPLLEKKVREDGMGRLLDEVELPLLGALLELEGNGVKIDAEHFASLSREFEKRMTAAAKDAFVAAGEEFNLDSPKQLQRILFDKLQLDPGKRTKTGFSTDVSVLEKLALKHELPAKILEYRQLAKLKGTYIDALPALVNPATGRIHTSYNQAVAATGRLSSSDPNLQNIPVRTAEGRLIRKGFVPEKGKLLVGADYSQIELRILAHLSADSRLQQAFRDGRDIHASTAQEIFGSADDEFRRRAKAINFGIIYGMSAFGLAQRLGIDQKTAQEYIDLYFSRYPGVKTYLAATLEEARRTGYVKTMFDRRRYTPDLKSQNRVISGAAERVAVNAPIQGSAADLMKIAMIRVSRRLRGTKMLLILQVHDELLLEVPGGEADAAAQVMKEEMEGVHPLSVPLRVDVSRGATWADME
ncbi:MAG: DNA polymerase I [Planctomycetes bacterium]|nr:DNA polymerase I [Planctomycetota bacterium]